MISPGYILDVMEDVRKRTRKIPAANTTTNCTTDCTTVKSERPKGEWLKTDKPGYRMCACCGIELMVYAQGNYCPNCGADMRGETE